MTEELEGDWQLQGLVEDVGRVQDVVVDAVQGGGLGQDYFMGSHRVVIHLQIAVIWIGMMMMMMLMMVMIWNVDNVDDIVDFIYLV